MLHMLKYLDLIVLHFSFSNLKCHLSVLDSLVDPLHKTINFKPKQDAVKQEVDRNEDMIRSALRAIASLNRIRLVYCALCKSAIYCA